MNSLSQYLDEPKIFHLVIAKHVIRYLKGMVNYGLNYTRDHDFILYSYTDAYFPGSVSDRKSSLGRCFSFGSTMISWLIGKQPSVSLSTTEEEYITACSPSCEVIWLWKMLSYLFNLEMDATMILCDNQRCMNMIEKPLLHDKMKHI